MKYVLIDDCGTDIFLMEYETKEQAIEEGAHEWKLLTKSEKERRKEFFVLESIDSDEESERHLDGEPVKRWK